MWDPHPRSVEGSSWTQKGLSCVSPIGPATHRHTHLSTLSHTPVSHAFKHMLPHTCVVTHTGTGTQTHRWTLEVLSTASPPPPGVFPVNSRLCVSHSSLGWLDGGSGHRPAWGPLLVPPHLWPLPNLTLGLEVAQVLKKSIQVLGELRV